MGMKFKFKNKIFEINPLSLKNINLDYIKKTSNKFINYEQFTIDAQKSYVRDIRKKGNEIYQIKYKEKLIATSGFQFYGSRTYQGLLIINDDFIGKGYAKYFIYSSLLFVNKTQKKKVFYANIDKKNIASIKSFLAAGYKIYEEKKFSLNLRLFKENVKNKIENKIQILK